MRVKIEVTIPDTDDCKTCGYLVWEEDPMQFRCGLFGEDLKPAWPRDPEKCKNCLSLSKKTREEES